MHLVLVQAPELMESKKKKKMRMNLKVELLLGPPQ
jgi:hypothetical protein